MSLIRCPLKLRFYTCWELSENPIFKRVGRTSKSRTMAGKANSPGSLHLGGGAQFWVYISPDNDTDKVVKGWEVTFSQGKWSDSITHLDPTKIIKSPGLSGIFDLSVTELDHSTNPPRRIAIPRIGIDSIHDVWIPCANTHDLQEFTI